LEAHYQERERVLEQNLRGLRAQVETLARQVNAFQQHLSALEQQARLCRSLFPWLEEKWWERFYGDPELER